MRIAYIIIAHKLPDQLVRLVRKLNSDTAIFLIHIDKKTNAEIYQKMVSPLENYKNVYFIKRHVCNWGHFTLVNASLKGIQEILRLGMACDYVVLLSGQDYPIKSNSYIQEFLLASDGRSYLEYFSLPTDRWDDGEGGFDRLNYWHFNFYGQEFTFLRKNGYLDHVPDQLWSTLAEIVPVSRSFPGSMDFFGGSAFWCLSRDCVEYIDSFVRQNIKFVKFFKYVKIPDEIFFQTILLNSPFQDLLVDDDLRYISWPSHPSRHPEILNKHDFERFINTENLFARKFDITVDTDVLDMIDKATL